MALCGFLGVASANPDAKPQQNTQQANVPTETALADTGADRQGSVTHTLPPVADAAAAATFRKDRPVGGTAFWLCVSRRRWRFSFLFQV